MGGHRHYGKVGLTGFLVAGVARIVIGIFFLLVGILLFFTPFGLLFGIFSLIIGIILIASGASARGDTARMQRQQEQTNLLLQQQLQMTAMQVNRQAAVQPQDPRPEPPAATADQYCPSCGMGNARAAAFCQKCGRPLGPSLAVSPVAKKPVPVAVAQRPVPVVVAQKPATVSSDYTLVDHAENVAKVTEEYSLATHPVWWESAQTPPPTLAAPSPSKPTVRPATPAQTTDAGTDLATPKPNAPQALAPPKPKRRAELAAGNADGWDEFESPLR
jgi:hypothetical protein